MTERIDNPKARKNRVICRSGSVPEGWVIVGEHHSPACEGEGANAWVIKLPGRREVVVEESPIPTGYHKVKETTLDTGNGKATGWLIEREVKK
jgi:hypothetical protein